MHKHELSNFDRRHCEIDVMKRRGKKSLKSSNAFLLIAAMLNGNIDYFEILQTLFALFEYKNS